MEKLSKAKIINKIKKLCLWVFVTGVLFSFSNIITVQAETYKGSCGAGVNWTADTDAGTLIIKGNGAIKDYKLWDTGPWVGGPWTAYNKDIHTLILEDGITQIGNNAFSGMDYIQEVIIPDSVTGIGEMAFAYCDGLKKVVLPAELTHLSNGTFDGDTSLVDIVWPEKLLSIGERVFRECSSLKKINIPESVTSIGGSAFAHCSSLQKIRIPDNVTSMGGMVLAYNPNLCKVILPDGLTHIPNAAFESCENLVSINFPKGLKSIGASAFHKCKSLKGVVLPEGLETIGNNSFQETPITSIIIPASVKNVKEYAFDGTNMEKIAFLGKNTSLTHSLTVGGRVGITTIYGYADSGAENYAVKYNYAFELITEDNLWVDVQGIWPNFLDVKAQDYFYKSVLWAVNNDITAGYSPTTFAPYDTCTRGQIVTFLWRAFGEPEVSEVTNTFTDVRSDMYYYDAVQWAVAKGITSGYNPQTFAPEDKCTRAQVISFLWRAIGKPMGEQMNSSFEDVNKNDYYYDAVAWAVENRITVGKNEKQFAPNDTCIRADVVTFLYRTNIK